MVFVVKIRFVSKLSECYVRRVFLSGGELKGDKRNIQIEDGVNICIQ